MKTINVSKGFFSRFKTIKSAVAYAQPGDKIVVEPGTYIEFLTINKPITIVGNDGTEKTILDGGISVESNVQLEQISIIKNQMKDTEVGLSISAGNSVIKDCQISGFDGTGILLKGDSELELHNSNIRQVKCGVKVYGNSSVKIKGSKITNCTENGVWILENAKGTIYNCIFTENNTAQIAIINGSKVVVENCKIFSSISNGILIEKATGNIFGCEFYDNKKSQLYIIDNSNVTIKDSKILQGKVETNGITIKNSSIQVENCKLSEHHYPQIFAKNARLNVKNTKIFNGRSTNGIRLTEKSNATFDDCEFNNNGNRQMSIESGSNLLIKNSKVHSNDNQGIVFDNAKGKIVNCELYQNKMEQISVLNSSDISVKDTRIYNPKLETNGIYVSEKSKIDINNCQVFEHDYPQIFISKKSQIRFYKLKLFKGTGTGIRILNSSTGVIDECEFYDNGPYPHISIEANSNITIQNSKIHSGNGIGIKFEGSKGVIMKCSIYQNQSKQIGIYDESNVQIKNSNIYNGKSETNGILVRGSSVAEIENCTLSEHDYPQIAVDQKSNLQLKKSKVVDGKDSGGIRILESTGFIEQCEFSNNGNYTHISVEKESNITVQNCQIHTGEGIGISYKSSEGVIQECSIYENRSKQVKIYDGSNVVIKDTSIFEGKSETYGILVTGSIADIENCTISKHDHPQIYVEQKSNINLKKSKIVDGVGSSGIRILDSKGMIDHCEFSNGAHSHINIEEESEITVQNCQLQSGQGNGIIVNSSKALINDCSLFENNYTQLEIENNGYAEVNRCRIYDGKSHGVRVRSNATALIQDVNVYGHIDEKYSQVVVQSGGNPIFRRCKIYNGQSHGFYFLENGLGTIEDSYIYEHKNCNFSITGGSEPILRKNRILNAIKYGVYMKDSNPIIEYCIFSNNQIADIELNSNCKPVLLQNELNSKNEEKQEKETANPLSKYEQAFGFNPYSMDKDDLKVRLLDEKKKWLNRINAPNIEKRQEAERMLMLIEELEKELLVS